MSDRIASLVPEITLFATMTFVLLAGVSPKRDTRSATPWIAGLGLFFAMVFGFSTPDVEGALLPGIAAYAKPLVCFIGLLLILTLGGVDRDFEDALDRGTPFNALNASRGEFIAFFLLSLTGVMLCTVASDLIWLFLALELTSLPTYVMVATARRNLESKEASVKYFFLGAMAAAVFLYGLALIYGGTGSLHLMEIKATIAADGLNLITTMGLLIAFIGLCFKIAAFPMHFYAADVYEGAETSVTAFLAFVPKTAGFLAMMLLFATLPWENGPLPEVLSASVWLVAVVTMTLGNALALWQRNVKRILAYSSVAHSGYLLIGLMAGPGDGSLTSSGYAAIMFYLLLYGLASVGSFLVLSCLERDGKEIKTLDDLSGICCGAGILSTVLSICALSLMGLPPIAGFFGKLHLFSTGISAGQYSLVVIAALNSAVAAWYYLKIAALPWIGTRDGSLEPSPYVGRKIAAILSAVLVLALVFAASPLMRASHDATMIVEVQHDNGHDAHHHHASLEMKP